MLYLRENMFYILFNNFFYYFFIIFRLYLLSINPISAGVPENQDMLGGGVNLTPPLNPMFDVKI